MTIRGGVRSLNARLARLEDHVVEPQGPVVYRVLFSDGTPVIPRAGEDPTVPLPSAHGGDEELVYRIASWEESELSAALAGVARHCGRPTARW